MKAPVFSGYSPLACRQDLYSVAIMFNLQTLEITAAEPELVKRCKKRKTPYQINRNVSLDSLRCRLNARHQTEYNYKAAI